MLATVEVKINGIRMGYKVELNVENPIQEGRFLEDIDNVTDGLKNQVLKVIGEKKED